MKLIKNSLSSLMSLSLKQSGSIDTKIERPSNDGGSGGGGGGVGVGRDQYPTPGVLRLQKGEEIEDKTFLQVSIELKEHASKVVNIPSINSPSSNSILCGRLSPAPTIFLFFREESSMSQMNKDKTQAKTSVLVISYLITPKLISKPRKSKLIKDIFLRLLRENTTVQCID